jgi:hypothetical protein
MKTINFVTCGKCGEVFGHILGVNKLCCPYCEFKEDICHFPDLPAEEVQKIKIING